MKLPPNQERRAVTALATRTWLDLARAVAWEFGLHPRDDELDMLLWEHTGFPSFWRTSDPVSECEAQLRAFFGGEA